MVWALHTCYHIHGRTTQFTQQFRILDLPGHDNVLGCDWMAQHSPVSFSYDPRQLIITYNKTNPVTIPACEAISNAAEINCLELNKLLLSGAPGLVLWLADDATLQCKQTQPPPPEIENLLQECLEVFTEPTGLPPKRV